MNPWGSRGFEGGKVSSGFPLRLGLGEEKNKMRQISLLILIIGILLLSACTAPSTVPPAESPLTPPKPELPAPTSTPIPTPVSEPSLELAKAEFENFLTYMKFNQWDKLWSMLHPDMKAVYGNEEEFAKNMEQRLNVKDSIIGPIQVIPQWICRSTEDLLGTEKTYSNVVEIPTTFIYTAVFGETEMSQMMYGVGVEKEWKFFIRKIKTSFKEAPIVLSTTSSELCSAYEDNELKADAEYKGKVLDVTGIIEDISRDIKGTPFVILGKGNGLAVGVKCEFSSEDETQLARLSKGEEITIRGKCVGYWIINVLLRGCSLVD